MQPISNQAVYVSDISSTNSVRVGPFKSIAFKSIVDLSQGLGDLLKSFLTGKEIASLNTTCSTLNHTSWLSEHRIRGEKLVMNILHQNEGLTSFQLSPIIQFKAKVGEVIDIYKSIEKRDFDSRLFVLHEIAKISTAHVFLRDIMKHFDFEELRVKEQASFSLLEYKLNPDPEKFERTQKLIREVVPKYGAYASQQMRLLHFEQAKQEYEGESLKKRLCEVFNDYLKEFRQGLPIRILIYLETYTIEALIEMGDEKSALALIQELEHEIETNPVTLTRAFKNAFLIKTANVKAKISFEKALESIKKNTSVDSANYKNFLLDFLIVSFEKKISSSTLKMLKELPLSNTEESDKALVFWNQIAREEIPDVETIIQNIDDTDLCVITMAMCARTHGKKNSKTAVKYLDEAMNLAQKKKDFHDRVSMLMKISTLSRIITS